MIHDKGVYVILIEALGKVKVGRLGNLSFDGAYLYVGSAQGAGGIKRVDRHLQVACGNNPTKRWHIDYLLKAGRPKDIFVAFTERKVECKLAQRLSREAIPVISGFGASDCKCRTHLFKSKLGKAKNDVYTAMKECGLKPQSYWSS